MGYTIRRYPAVPVVQLSCHRVQSFKIYEKYNLQVLTTYHLNTAKYLKFFNPGIANSDLALIWDLSDRNKVGALDLLGLATAVKLVALVQNGIPPTAENLK